MGVSAQPADVHTTPVAAAARNLVGHPSCCLANALSTASTTSAADAFVRSMGGCPPIVNTTPPLPCRPALRSRSMRRCTRCLSFRRSAKSSPASTVSVAPAPYWRRPPKSDIDDVAQQPERHPPARAVWGFHRRGALVDPHDGADLGLHVAVFERHLLAAAEVLPARL